PFVAGEARKMSLAGGRLGLCLGSLRYLRNAGGVGEELLHLCDLQCVTNAFVHACQRHRVTILLVADIGTDHSAKTGGVNVRNLCKGEDKGGRAVGADHVLKLVESGDGQWPGKPEHACIVLQPEVFNLKWFVTHLRDFNARNGFVNGSARILTIQNQRAIWKDDEGSASDCSFTLNHSSDAPTLSECNFVSFILHCWFDLNQRH